MNVTSYFYAIDTNGNLVLQTNYGELVYAPAATNYPINPGAASPICCCGYICQQASNETP